MREDGCKPWHILLLRKKVANVLLIIQQKLKEYIVFTLDKRCSCEGKIKHIAYVTRNKQIILHDDKCGDMDISVANYYRALSKIRQFDLIPYSSQLYFSIDLMSWSMTSQINNTRKSTKFIFWIELDHYRSNFEWAFFTLRARSLPAFGKTKPNYLDFQILKWEYWPNNPEIADFFFITQTKSTSLN